MNIINTLIKDVVKFAAEKDLDLKFIALLIDYLLAEIEVDLENPMEVETYINTVRTSNQLVMLLGLTTDYTNKERKFYNNDLLIPLLDQPHRLTKYKESKLNLYSKYHAEKIDIFEEYRKELL